MSDGYLLDPEYANFKINLDNPEEDGIIAVSLNTDMVVTMLPDVVEEGGKMFHRRTIKPFSADGNPPRTSTLMAEFGEHKVYIRNNRIFITKERLDV